MASCSSAVFCDLVRIGLHVLHVRLGQSIGELLAVEDFAILLNVLDCHGAELHEPQRLLLPTRQHLLQHFEQELWQGRLGALQVQQFVRHRLMTDIPNRQKQCVAAYFNNLSGLPVARATTPKGGLGALLPNTAETPSGDSTSTSRPCQASQSRHGSTTKLLRDASPKSYTVNLPMATSFAGHKSAPPPPMFDKTHIQECLGGLTNEPTWSNAVCQDPANFPKSPMSHKWRTHRSSAAALNWSCGLRVGQSGAPLPTTLRTLTVLSFGVVRKRAFGIRALFNEGMGTADGSTSSKP